MKELKRYKRALLLYQLSYFLPKYWFRTDDGFCHHFGGFENFKQDLPILYNLKPQYNFFCLGPYWFETGLLKPRIELLKQAIKLCKLNYNIK